MRVVYHSFAGRYSDNPRVLYEALRTDARTSHLWLADPRHQAEFPVGVPTVPLHSAAARSALQQADTVVSNTHLGLAWDKRADTRCLQTWHGTPLKRISLDTPGASPELVATVRADVGTWDALLSPSPASTASLRSAFDFAGEVAETGYPRNDVLSAPGRGAVRERVRTALGIPAGAPVVLYTPTWRDDVVDPGGEPDVELHLDLDELARRLPDHVLLVRLHYKLSDRLAGRGALDRPGVRDVSGHPDVAELYLAADVMVTDYSSTMFDFAVTGKPMLFFAYDLEHYRDGVRGFYLDLTEIAPGPVLRTSTEVADALTDLDVVHTRHQAAYTRFVGRFCPHEDGRATARVLQRYFPDHPTPEEAS